MSNINNSYDPRPWIVGYESANNSTEGDGDVSDEHSGTSDGSDSSDFEDGAAIVAFSRKLTEDADARIMQESSGVRHFMNSGLLHDASDVTAADIAEVRPIITNWMKSVHSLPVVEFMARGTGVSVDKLMDVLAAVLDIGFDVVETQIAK